MSIMSRVLYGVMRIINYRTTVEKKFLEVIKTGKRPEKQAEPFSSKKLVNHYQIITSKALNSKVFTIGTEPSTSPKVILYFHGGAYLQSAVKQHWDYIDSLIAETGCTVVVPDYPLAPGSSYREVFETVDLIYHDLITKHAPENLILMGDSAGGGIALAYAQNLRDRQLVQPGHIILLSPWLDISMTNPGIPAVEKRDPFLPVNGLVAAGKAYAKDLSVKDPRVSPIYGDCRNLGKITLFTGTRDVLWPDAKKFKTLCDAQGIPVNYFEYPEMLHVWMILGLPESAKVIGEIGEILG